MDVLALVLAVVLAVACVVFVARPFLREPTPEEELPRERDAADEERLRLVEERDRALAALKELEFDHRTGKISDADYRELVVPLRREAAAALASLDPKAAAAEPRRERVDAHA
jgi:hypothetical protein